MPSTRTAANTDAAGPADSPADSPGSVGASGRLAIVLVNGICMRRDAISEVLFAQREVLETAGHKVTIIAQHRSDNSEQDRVLICGSSWQLMRMAAIREADVVVFHYGITYDLFDALLLPHTQAKTVVHFHNVTPPECLEGEAQQIAIQSLDKLHLVALADEIWSDSPHNSEVLSHATGIESDRISDMALFVRASMGTNALTKPLDHSDLRILVVGRLVPAKGHDLILDAIALLPRECLHRVSLRIVGTDRHSPSGYLNKLTKLVAENELEDQVAFCLDHDDEALIKDYLWADLFVSASAHEGFCVPIVEALAHGCRVVATNVGATSSTLGACGSLLPTREPQSLAAALRDEFTLFDARRDGTEEALLSERDRRSRTSEHLVQFSMASFAERTLHGIELLADHNNRGR